LTLTLPPRLRRVCNRVASLIPPNGEEKSLASNKTQAYQWPLVLKKKME
jgi:hypothetical protein